MDDTNDTPVTDEALDRELSAAFAVEPSPELMARIRSRVASEPMRPSWQAGWAVVAWSGGGLSLAAAAVLVAMLWSPSTKVTRPAVIATPVSRATDSRKPVAVVDVIPPDAPASAAAGIPGPAVVRDPGAVRTAARNPRPAASPHSESQVIVAPGEAAALRRLFADVGEGRVSVSVLPGLSAVPAPLAPIENIEVPPIAMSPLRPIKDLGVL